MDGWTLLARNGADTSVSRCPEGHIHLEYGATNLKLDDRRFLELARAVCTAAQKLGSSPGDCGARHGGEVAGGWPRPN